MTEKKSHDNSWLWIQAAVYDFGHRMATKGSDEKLPVLKNYTFVVQVINFFCFVLFFKKASELQKSLICPSLPSCALNTQCVCAQTLHRQTDFILLFSWCLSSHTHTHSLILVLLWRHLPWNFQMTSVLRLTYSRKTWQKTSQTASHARKKVFRNIRKFCTRVFNIDNFLHIFCLNIVWLLSAEWTKQNHC